MKTEITKDDIAEIYDEVERRLARDLFDGAFKNDNEFAQQRIAMLQGVYSALMCISEDWSKTVSLIDEEEESRY